MEMHLWFFSYYYYFSFLEVERRNANQILVEVYLRASTIYRYNCFLSQQQYCSASSAETRIVLSEALLSRVRSPTAIVWYCSIVGCIMCVNLLHPIQSSLLRALSTWTSRNLQGKSFYNLSQCIIILVVGGGKESYIQLETPLFQVMGVVCHSPIKSVFGRQHWVCPELPLLQAEQGCVLQTLHTGPVLQPYDHLDGIWQAFCCFSIVISSYNFQEENVQFKSLANAKAVLYCQSRTGKMRTDGD